MNYSRQIRHVLELIEKEGFKVVWHDVEKFKDCTCYTLVDEVHMPRQFKATMSMFCIVTHELQHLMQYKEGKFSKRDTLRAELLSEYDAERRTWAFVKKYCDAKIYKKRFVVHANKYMQHIKWAWNERSNDTDKKWIHDYDNVPIRVYERWMRKDELFKELSDEDRMVFDAYYEKIRSE